MTNNIPAVNFAHWANEFYRIVTCPERKSTLPRQSDGMVQSGADQGFFSRKGGGGVGGELGGTFRIYGACQENNNYY